MPQENGRPRRFAGPLRTLSLCLCLVATASQLVAAEPDERKYLLERFDDVGVLLEFLAEDASHLKDANRELALFKSSLREMELRAMLSEPNDKADAIVNINAGAGGTEAQDWAGMLLRMYLRYGDAQGFKSQVVDQQSGDESSA